MLVPNLHICKFSRNERGSKKKLLGNRNTPLFFYFFSSRVPNFEGTKLRGKRLSTESVLPLKSRLPELFISLIRFVQTHLGQFLENGKHNLLICKVDTAGRKKGTVSQTCIYARSNTGSNFFREKDEHSAKIEQLAYMQVCIAKG